MDIVRCRIKGCGSIAAKRGLCLMCYSKAKKKVDAGVITWDKLAEVGLCEPDHDPFDAAFNEATKGK